MVAFGLVGVVARDWPRIRFWLIGCVRDLYVCFCVWDFGCADSVNFVLLVTMCVRVCRVVGVVWYGSVVGGRMGWCLGVGVAKGNIFVGWLFSNGWSNGNVPKGNSFCCVPKW